MSDYNLVALPVLDDEGCLQGIITIDDAIEWVLPDDWRARAGESGLQRAATIVGDYIAGMTDRYAMDEHRRLTDLSVSG